MKVRSTLRHLLFVVFASTLIAGTYKYHSRWQEVTEAPLRSYTSEALMPLDSVLNAPVEMSLATVASSLNSRLPGSLAHTWKDSATFHVNTGVPKISCNWLKCKKVGWNTIRVDVPYHGDVRITREPIQLVGHGQEVEIKIPVRFWARISGRGSLGKNVHETAEGAFTLSAKASATIMPDWTVTLATSPVIEWHGAPGGKLFNVAPYTIRSLVEGLLVKEIGKAVSMLESETNSSLALRERADELWRGAFSIHAVGGDFPAWVSVTPKGLAWAPLLFSDGEITSAVRLVLGMSVSTEKPDNVPVPTPLPSLMHVDDRLEDGVILNSPLVVSYDSLSAHALKAAKSVTALSDRGVDVVSIDAFPAADRLGVRVTARLDLPGSLLDTRAIIYATGVPVLDGSAQTVSLENFSLTRTLDNRLVDMFQVPLHDLLERSIAEELRSKTGPLVDEANAQIKKTLAPLADKGVEVSATIESLAVGKLVLMEDSMLLPLQVTGTVRAVLDAELVADGR